MITGFFSSRGRPYIEGTVTLPRFGVSADVPFLLDTGADSSCLHFRHTRELAVPESSLRNRSSVGGIGGTAAYYREPAIVTFTYGDGRIDEVSYNIDLDLSYSDETIGLPSLLGRDILDDWHIEYSRKCNLLRCTV